MALTKWIADGANLDQKDHLGRTPLHLAAWAGQLDAVKALVAAGAGLKAVGQDDTNALHFAAQKGRTKGATALHIAAHGNHRELVQLLLHRKADPAAQNKREQTAADLAADPGLKQLLIEAVESKATSTAANSEDAPKQKAKKQRNVRKAGSPGAGNGIDAPSPQQQAAARPPSTPATVAAEETEEEPHAEIGAELPPEVAARLQQAAAAEEAAAEAAAAEQQAAEGGEAPAAAAAAAATEPAAVGEEREKEAPPKKKAKVQLSYLEEDEDFEQE
eukprot:scaffold14.g1103.t1